MAGHMEAVFDSALRFWQGAPRKLDVPLIKGLPETTFLGQSTRNFFQPFCPPLHKGRRVLRNDNGEA